MHPDANPAPSEPAMAARRVRILLVEDEVLIRMMAAEMLVDAGFDVREAGSAAEALGLVSGDGTGEEAEFVAAVLDIGLPDQTGDVLAADLRARRPGMAIVLATGYDERVARGFGPELGAELVSKPYDADQLLDALVRAGVTAPGAAPAPGAGPHV